MNHNHPPLLLHLPDEAATVFLGQIIASHLARGMRVYLSGDLGAGKTCLVRALLRSLGFEGPVKSPTYTLVEAYNVSSLYLYHFDFYRFRERNEWIDSGFREYFATNAVCLVEWPDKAEGLLPEPDLEIFIDLRDDGRDARIVSHGEAGARCVAALQRSSLARIG
jgi:tRNA threonylcarbamoyladenosine biosynthesis protein TsaE